MKGQFWRKALAAALALMIVSGGVPVEPFTEIFRPVAITASAADYLTDFLTVSATGTATGYSTCSDHFYKVEWSGINTSKTTSVALYSAANGNLKAQRNGQQDENINLYSSESRTYWLSSNITSLTPGQSSYGYTSFGDLATGADGTSYPPVYKKVCTITCMAANEPTWNWSADCSTCTATFTCADDPSLTATVNATVTDANGGKTASVTFNGTQYSDTKKASCTVTWKNYDGTVLKTDTAEYGSTPSYSGATPTKPENAQYSYTFSGWSPAVSAVTSDTTYTAQFSSTVNKYTVTWKNGDTTLETDTDVPYGTTPTYDGLTPTKEGDTKYSYEFSGWSPNVSSVVGNTVYNATFTQVPKSYNVTYMVDGEVYGEVDTAPYGTELTARQAPAREGCTFSGWSEIPKTMPDKDVVITGTFAQNNYNIAISDGIANGSVSSDKTTAHYGDNVKVTIEPENGYYVLSVQAGNAIVNKISENIYSFNMPADDVTINVDFVRKIPAKAATCTQDGNLEYYKSDSGRIYIMIERAYFESSLDAVTVSKTGHSYDEPVWDWSEDNSAASAIFTCAKCDDEETVDAVITSETFAPTYETEGKIVYTAKVVFNGTEYTETKEVVIPKKVLVATVGDKEFDSLKAAIDAAYSDETIVVYADVDEPDVDPGQDQTWGTYNKNIELDLNGHTVTFGTFASNYDITIKNGTLNCMINNVSNYFATLTLDNAVLNTPEAEDEYSQGISWMADRIEIKNGSKMVINGNAYFNGWYCDPFSFDIDESSSVIMNNVLLSGSNEETVLAEIGEYLPAGYSFGKLEDEYSYRIFNADGEVVTTPVTLKQPVRTEVIIRSIDIDGDITSTKVYAETFTKTDYTVPASPYLDGYNFVGWTVNSRFLTTADEVQETVAALIATNPKAPITVAVVYEKKVDSFKVTVINGSLSEGESGDNYQVGTELIATAAPAEEGLQFDHWENNGAVASYNEVYSFHVPSKEITLKAVYSSAETEIEKVGTAFIESVTTVNGNKIAFVSKFSIPEGARFLKAGIIANTEAALNGEELTTDTAKYIRYDDSKCYNYLTYKFTWTKSNVSEDDVWCVCPYLVYNDENGEHTVYGDLVKADLNGIITE